MTTTFFTIANSLGIACASDSEHTIYKLSKSEPLAIAVCPYAPIPWDDIIEAYRRKGEPECHEDFADYVRDFSRHLASYPWTQSLDKLNQESLSVVFMGYGSEDLYPGIIKTYVSFDKNNQHLFLEETEAKPIQGYGCSDLDTIGDFDCISPVLCGITDPFLDSMDEACVAAFETYKKKVLAKFAGTKYENRVKEAFENFDIHSFIDLEHSKTFGNCYSSLNSGLMSFSMEDMVYSCEKIVNASARLNHLRSGGKIPQTSVKEIAVLTRTEGVTWIKHSLFAI